MDKRIQYMNELKYLPEFIQDFHDQKDLFKAIYQQWQDENEVLKKVNWVDAHVFTIDIFLWWMGLHGYKLQRIRSKSVDFPDPKDTIDFFSDKRRANFADILNKRIQENKANE